MSTEVLVTSVQPLASVDAGVFSNRFLLVSVAVQRSVQIRAGSRPRVDPGRHKATVIAVAEVVAGTVPYMVA
jgi:DNA-directed RNA polymerase omega subunit